LLDAYFERMAIRDESPEEFTFESESHDDSPRRNAREDEVDHLAYIARRDWELGWNAQPGDKLKELAMSGMFFQYFAADVGTDIFAQMYALTSFPCPLQLIVYRGNRSWPFKIIMKCPTDPVEKQLRTYKPVSDFMIAKSNIPRLLVEVNSRPREEWPSNLVRMILMGAAVVRFANRFLTRFAGRFVLFAMYIWDDGKVTRYSLFQKQCNQSVCWTSYVYLNSLAELL